MVVSQDSPRMTLSKVLGNVPYIYKFCQDQRIADVINTIVPSNERTDQVISLGELVTLLVVNRLTAPQPLYKIAKWAENVGMEYYLSCNAKSLNDDRLGRALDRLEPYLFEIQETLVLDLVTRHEIDPSAIHYDITSIYFEGAYDQVGWVNLGYSRDKKPGKVQVNLGLNTTDEENFPVFWKDLPGNTQDTTTVIENMNQLKRRFPKVKLIHIGDRAMFSIEIYRKSQELGIDLIAPLKNCDASKALLQTINAEDLPEVRCESKSQTVNYRLGEYELSLDETGDLPPLRALVVWSKTKAEQAQRQREKKITQRRQALADLQTKLNQPYYRKYTTVSKKIIKIMKYDPVNDGFNVVLSGEDHALALEVHEKEQAWEALSPQDGLYILVTTVVPEFMGAWEVFDFYKRQGSVEWCFRTIKNPLKVRPLFVQLPQRIRALIFIVMLALVMYSLIELLLRRQHLDLTPSQLFHQLNALVLVQVYLPDTSLHFMLSPPDPREHPLLQALNWQSVRDWLLAQVHQRVRGMEAPEPFNTR